MRMRRSPRRAMSITSRDGGGGGKVFATRVGTKAAVRTRTGAAVIATPRRKRRPGAKAGLIARSRRASLPISAVATASAVRKALPVARRGATRTCRPIRTCRSIRRWPKSWRGSARWTARLPANASPPSGSNRRRPSRIQAKAAPRCARARRLRLRPPRVRHPTWVASTGNCGRSRRASRRCGRQANSRRRSRPCAPISPTSAAR